MSSDQTAYEARDKQTTTEGQDPTEAEIELLHEELKILTGVLDLIRGTPEGTADILKDRLNVLARLWTLEYSQVCTNPWKNSIELDHASVASAALLDTGDSR